MVLPFRMHRLPSRRKTSKGAHSNLRPASAFRLMVVGIFLLALIPRVPAQPQTDRVMVVPLERAHAHNDYEHTRPLLDALDHGFCSVEADIHLVDGELLVAHDLHQTRPGRTLETLYLEPLRQRVQQHHGTVFPHGPAFILLIDVKSDADAAYAVLRQRLRPYADILTRFESGRAIPNAVTAILSGNRPRQRLLEDPVRYAAYDGRVADLNSRLSPDFMPLVSDNWRSLFGWRGDGPFPDVERQKLQELVDRAHQQGFKIRFWGAPDRPAAWQVLHDAKVDLINTDNLAGLRAFLLESDPGSVISP
jgi:hypothetical protein